MLEKQFCSRCSGPHLGWFLSEFGGHWDTCPDRVDRKVARVAGVDGVIHRVAEAIRLELKRQADDSHDGPYVNLSDDIEDTHIDGRANLVSVAAAALEAAVVGNDFESRVRAAAEVIAIAAGTRIDVVPEWVDGYVPLARDVVLAAFAASDSAEVRLASVNEWAVRTRGILPEPLPEWADMVDAGRQAAAIEVLEILGANA